MVIYGKRNRILEKGDIHEEIVAMVREQAGALVEGILYNEDKYEWDFDRLISEVNTFAGKEIITTVDITDTEDKEAIKE